MITEMEGKDQSEEGKNKLNELQKKRSYQAYYNLILEYQEKYGMGKIKTRNQEAFCLEGLCFASLLDFDQNGKEELVLAYLSEMPENEPPIPRYTVEVWELKKGKVDKVYTGNPYRAVLASYLLLHKWKSRIIHRRKAKVYQRWMILSGDLMKNKNLKRLQNPNG